MSRKAGKFFSYLFVACMAFLALFPIFALLLASFKPSTELLQYGLNLNLQPDKLTLNNYISIFTSSGNYLSWYKNSIIVLLIATPCSLLLSSMVGYALAVYQFRGKKVIFLLVILILIIPVEILLLPLYQLISSLSLMNSFGGLILPFLVSPLAVFFLRQYAAGLPSALLDAARIDGCMEYRIFFQIMMPVMLPAYGAMAVLLAMNNWNSFIWPLIVMQSNASFTLPVGIASLNSPYSTNYEIMLSGSALTVIPIVIIFFFFQKYFIAGLTSGSVKE